MQRSVTDDISLIRAASLRGFAPLVRELGGRPEQLLRRFGIEPEVLEDPDGLISISAHDLMLDAAAVDLGCPDLGLRLGQSQDLTILGPLAVAIQASSTVNQALECVTRFLFVHSPALRIAVEDDPQGVSGIVAITYRKDLRESSYSPQAMELGLALLHRTTVALVGPDTGLRSVLLPHAPLSPVARYTEVFGDAVRFNAPVAGLRVHRSTLDVRFSGADSTIRDLAVAHLARSHADPSRRLAVRLRWVLADTLGTTGHSVEDVARLLHLHPRTLQRRLTAEGTSYEDVLDDVRRERALRLITTTRLPLAQVATMVGFSAQSTLSRAVRRWVGRSPRDLRCQDEASATLSR